MYQHIVFVSLHNFPSDINTIDTNGKLEEIVVELKSEIDLAFLFGLQYIAGGLENVISEMHRILKPGGVFSFKKRVIEVLFSVKYCTFTEFSLYLVNAYRFKWACID